MGFIVDVYKKGTGVLKTFPVVSNIDEVNKIISSYIKENNLTVIGREVCVDSVWTYLSDGTEIDYSIL